MITKQYTTDKNINDAYMKLFSEANQILNKIIDNPKLTSVQLDDSNIQYPIDASILESVKKIVNPCEKPNNPETGETEYTVRTDDVKKVYPGLFDIETVTPEGSETSTTVANININSLSEYFAVLGVLSKIHPKFGRIPLDESFFTIDLNTRSIKAPKSNFVYAVKGDHRAETLYFIADRYFDGVDLGYENTNIIIQSEMGTSKNLSKAVLIDRDSKPGYLIFGWPLTNIVTEKNGTLKFAIRFYVNNNDGAIAYSLGTLPQTLTIQSSLFDIKINGTVDDTVPFFINYPITGTPDIVTPDLTNNTTAKDSLISDISDGKSFFMAEADTGSGSIGQKFTYHWYYSDGQAENPTFGEYTIEPRSVTLMNKTDIDKSDQVTYYNASGNHEELEKDRISIPEGEEGQEVLVVDNRKCYPNAGGIYKCDITTEVGLFKDSVSAGPYYVSVPQRVEFAKDDNKNYVDNGLQYTYYATDNYSKFDLSDYVTKSKLIFNDDDKTNKRYFKGIPIDSISDTKNTNNMQIIRIDDGDSDASEQTFGIEYTINNVAVKSENNFTVNLIPEIEELEAENIKRDKGTSTDGGTSYSLSIDEDPNSALITSGYVSREYSAIASVAGQEITLEINNGILTIPKDLEAHTSISITDSWNLQNGETVHSEYPTGHINTFTFNDLPVLEKSEG